MNRVIGTSVVFGFVVLLGLITLVMGCSPVSSGYVGVRTTFGKVHEKSLEPGLHFIIPYVDSVVQLETRLKPFEVRAQSSSKDLQVVETVISVQHSLNGEMAAQSYQKIGDLSKFDAAVVSPAVLESLKAVTAHYTAEELITKRDIVKTQIVASIQEFIDDTLEDKGLKGAIHVSNTAIQDFDFSAGFNASIESKVKAQQEALRAENEKVKRITEAEASAREKELAADAEAYRTKQVAEADAYQIEQMSVQRAAAIEREAKALAQNPLLLQLRAIEKWSGKVPSVNLGGGSAVPFLDIIKIAEQTTTEEEE